MKTENVVALSFVGGAFADMAIILSTAVLERQQPTFRRTARAEVADDAPS
jgi:hypothetical protein